MVELKNESLQVIHIEQLFRYITAIRAGLKTIGVYPYHPKDRARNVNVFVCGALIGPKVSDSAAIVDALLATQWDAEDETPLRLGIVKLHPTEGLEVDRFCEYERFPPTHSDAENNQSAEAVTKLFAESKFFPQPPSCHGQPGPKGAMSIKLVHDSVDPNV